MRVRRPPRPGQPADARRSRGLPAAAPNGTAQDAGATRALPGAAADAERQDRQAEPAHARRRAHRVSSIESTTLLLERAGAVLWIRLNRPDARNGIDPTMRDELTAVLAQADADAQVRAIVLTGTGRDFCTGADLMPAGETGAAAQRPPSALDYRRAVGPFQRLFQTLWECETPAVSAVHGTIAGAGWMLALLADLVAAAEGARWTHVFARR